MSNLLLLLLISLMPVILGLSIGLSRAVPGRRAAIGKSPPLSQPKYDRAGAAEALRACLEQQREEEALLASSDATSAGPAGTPPPPTSAASLGSNELWKEFWRERDREYWNHHHDRD